MLKIHEGHQTAAKRADCRGVGLFGTSEECFSGCERKKMCNPEVSDHRVTTRRSNNNNNNNMKKGPVLDQTFPACQPLAVPCSTFKSTVTQPRNQLEMPGLVCDLCTLHPPSFSTALLLSMEMLSRTRLLHNRQQRQGDEHRKGML